MTLVTILGGTGVFGSRIARNLAHSTDATLRIVGRNEALGRSIAQKVSGEFCSADVGDEASLRRATDGSFVVIHAAGPFQGRDYSVARHCIDAGVHYLDLADARDFVAGITQLDDAATKRAVFICSGVSSVPAVTHAMVSDVLPEVGPVDTINIALSPGNQNPRGASTIAAILTYVGKPIRTWDRGAWKNRPGWGYGHNRLFPFPVGVRRVHNCDVPDLELFPEAFGAHSVHFFAGVELNIINSTLSAIGRLRRFIPFRDLDRLAPLFLKGSLLLYRFGSKNGSLAVWVHRVDGDGKSVVRCVAIVTEHDGPATPCSPATILTQKMLRDGPPAIGAMPCMGFLTLAEIADHLRQFGVRVVRGDGHGWQDPTRSPSRTTCRG